MAARKKRGAQAPVDATVNLEELAEIVGKSLPTLRSLMRGSDDFPVISHGKNGVAYEFDARAVAGWMSANDERVRAEDVARGDRVAQLRLELYGDDMPEDGTVGFTPQQRKHEYEAQRLADMLAAARGELTRTADVEMRIREAFRKLRGALLALPDDLGRELDLEREVRVGLRDRIDTALARCAAMLGSQDAYDVAA